ncbi:hypothetical protein [Brevibacterium gallinarum]|uniref:N-acetyltransferase domain-containing protein n=1 Tax=Brevibacterium gallinarum TaxID=2762220 RepID=A0ABR8WQF3_9MICO|nr:hypothetical protein [Brevibacterium gallinarum]MBD8019309.1 hypothetical protein [Brevibacterium gallinarum]
MLITVSEVSTRAELREFLDFPAALATSQGGADHWVPLLRSDVTTWWTGRSWFPADVTLLIAKDPVGRVVGRTTAHRYPALDERLSGRLRRRLTPPEVQAGVVDDWQHRQVRAQLFGATEFETPEAAEAIFAELEARAQAAGCTHLFGPVSLLPNQTGGVVVAGHQHPGFFDTVWNTAATAEAYEAAGFHRWGGGHTWEVELADVPAARATAPSAAECAAAGVRITTPSRFELTRALGRIHPTMNAAFDALTYYTPITDAQFASQTQGLALLMDPGLIVTAEDLDAGPGDPAAAFILTVPDPVRVLRATGGRLNATAAALLARQQLTGRTASGTGRDAVLIVQAAHPEAQGRGLVSLLARKMYSELVRKGYRRLRVTFVGDDNLGSSAVPGRAGGHWLHELRFFFREVHA